jgi:hypothetical protein
MSKLLQKQLSDFYKTQYSCNKLYKYIGCTRDEFYDYIASLLIPPMNPYNVGIEWHFDHIVPKVLFSPDEYNICWNYQNILPMLITDNKYKGSSIHFSIEYLRSIPETDITKQLIVKSLEEIKRYDKYLMK